MNYQMLTRNQINLGHTSNAMRTMVGARSIHLKPGLLSKEVQSKGKLVPSFRAVRNQSVQMKKVVLKASSQH